MVEYAYKENGVMKLKPVALSLSQSEIDEIATELLEAMQPDWQNAVALTASQLTSGYTVPDDGMIVGWSVPATGISYATVNGIVISRADQIPSSYACFTNVQCQVNKGDIFKIDYIETNGYSMSFVPFKTSNPVSLRPLDPHKIDTAILNHWDDITSDFSTAGSTAGFVLDRAVYNQILRKLRVNYHTTVSWAAGTTKYFILTYNGSDLPAFTRTCFYRGSMILEAAASGCEDSYIIQQANKLSIDVYNRNNSTAWPAGVAFTVQVEF